jgi:hypothetical protein
MYTSPLTGPRKFMELSQAINMSSLRDFKSIPFHPNSSHNDLRVQTLRHSLDNSIRGERDDIA